jgi:hypothetical protein
MPRRNINLQLVVIDGMPRSHEETGWNETTVPEKYTAEPSMPGKLELPPSIHPHSLHRLGAFNEGGDCNPTCAQDHRQWRMV